MRISRRLLPPPAAAADPSPALLAQATTAFEAGNLQVAKTAAQGVTDPNLKPVAGRILSDIDRYSGLVAAGQHHEQAQEYAQAEHSYQSALELNSHVGADDLSGKIQHMHQLASAPATPVPAATPPPAQAPVVVATNNVPKPVANDNKTVKPPDISPDEKKKKLLEEGAQAMARNDLDTAGRLLKQVLDIDPANADAKRGLADITAALSKDPVRLEKTLREAIIAFYSSDFEDAESRLNRYLGADGGKKKGAAYFYLGATEATLAILDGNNKRTVREREAREDFKQARSAGYQPVEKYVSSKILEVWKKPGV